MSTKRNILVMVADQMRGDCVPTPDVKTPNIDRIGEGGVTFGRAFTVNPLCAPSRCCMFTGLYPHSGAHRSLYQLLRPHEENMFHLLKENGYEVAWIGRNDLFTRDAATVSVSRRIGHLPEDLRDAYRALAAGKPEAKALLGKFVKQNPFPPGHRLHKSFYYGERTRQQAAYDYDKLVTDKALEYLDGYGRSDRTAPFCLYLAFAFPHPPYTVEEPYFSMYDRAKMRPALLGAGSVTLDDKPAFMSTIRRRYGLQNLTMEDFCEIRAVYYGMISKLDAQIGRVLDKMGEAGLTDDTAVVFVSDHGDYTGNYGLVEKWHTDMRDCLLHVPLLLRVPGLAPPARFSDALVETIDIFPTVLELAGVSTRYTHFGKSLVPVLKGEAKYHRDAVFADGGFDPREPQCFEDPVKDPDDPSLGIYYEKTNMPADDRALACRTAMVRTEDWKLVIRSAQGQVEELYDVRNDPGELVNLINRPEHAGRVRELRDRLLTWYLQTSDNPHWEHRREV